MDDGEVPLVENNSDIVAGHVSPDSPDNSVKDGCGGIFARWYSLWDSGSPVFNRRYDLLVFD